MEKEAAVDQPMGVYCIAVRLVEGRRHRYAMAALNPNPGAAMPLDDCLIQTVTEEEAGGQYRAMARAVLSLAVQTGVQVSKRPDHFDGEWYFFLVMV